jgi:acrylyl-CoA reductase (NADPH)
MTFKALVVDKNEEGKTSAAVKEIDENQLPDGNVTVAVEYSTLNYKDGLCVGPGGGLVKEYPHVPGIDFAGTVEESSDEWYKPGDKVVLTGWRVGEVWWGGYAQKASVKGEWLVPLPDGLTTRDAMAVGTAGFTAMLAVIALEDHGLKPETDLFWSRAQQAVLAPSRSRSWPTSVMKCMPSPAGKAPGTT